MKKPKIILSDFGAVLIFSTDKEYKGKLNPLYEKVKHKSDFVFENYFYLNKELLFNYQKLKSSGIDFYMVTNGYIQQDPHIYSYIKYIFSKIYSGEELLLSKKDKDIYIHIVKDLKVSPNDVIFIDDSIDNLNAAKEAGLRTIQYINNEEIIKALNFSY